MSRLTDRKLIDDGIVGCVDNNKNKCNDNCMYGHCKWVRECLLKLKEYEDLEEQGLLLKLPCKVGTTVYSIAEDCGGDTLNCRYPECNNCVDFYRFIEENAFDTYMMDVIGKEVLLTKEEAEKALEILEKDNE